MNKKELLNNIWNMKKVDRPALVLEEPSFKYQSLNLDASKEEIFNNRYSKYQALNDNRSDNIATMDCTLGTHIIPCILGGEERIFEDGHRYLSKSVIFSANDVDKIKKVDVKTGLVGKQIELIKYFADKTNGEIPIRVGDIQNPLGVAEMLWNTEDFYTALYETPEKVHQLLEIITEVVIEYISEMLIISDNIVPIVCPSIWAPKDKGVYLADDTMSMVSPDMYEEFGVTYNNKISEVFGGIMLHSCTTNERYFDKIMLNKNIRSINFAAQYSSDMSKIYEYFGGKIVVLPHYIHTDSPQIGTVTEFLEKVISCWKPETPSIIYIAENPQKLIQQEVIDTYNKYFKL